MKYSPPKDEQAAVDEGTHVFCVCGNCIPINANDCPYCHKLNFKAKEGKCPTCGKPYKQGE